MSSISYGYDVAFVAQRLTRIADGLVSLRKQLIAIEAELNKEAKREWAEQVRRHGEDRVLAHGSRLHRLASRLSDARECVDGVGSDYGTDVKNLRNAAKFLTGRKRPQRKPSRAKKRKRA